MAEDSGRTGHVIDILILEAFGHQSLGDTEKAISVLGQALSLAEPEGYIRTFIDEGEPMAQLLRLAASHGTAKNYVKSLLTEFQRQGIGRRLVHWSLDKSKENGKFYILVKTLSSKHPDKFYKRTRHFYENVGFVPLEELETLWGEGNPCLNMIMEVER